MIKLRTAKSEAQIASTGSDWENKNAAPELVRRLGADALLAHTLAERIAALEFARDTWREQAEASGARVSELEAELERVESACACGYCGEVHDDGGRCEL